MKTNKQKRNTAAIGVGFFLIAGVALLTFLGNGSKNGEKEPSQKTTVQKNANLKSIGSEALLKKISFGESTNIIDIRNAESFAAEHILGALNYSPEEIQKNSDSFDKSAEYVIIDDFGLTPTALVIMNYLSEKGFENAAYLEGGLIDWKEKFNPTVILGNPYSFSDQAKVSYIKSEELKSAIDNGENIFIIDMRRPERFSLAHIQGAVNISFEELESRRKDIPRGKKIIVGGADAVSSFQGAARLFDMGFTNVLALDEGFK